MEKIHNGIGKRIAKLIAFSTIASVLFAASIQTFMQVDSQIVGRQAALEATAYALASAASEAVVANNSHAAMLALTAVSRVPNIDMASIILPNGKLLASMGNSAFLISDAINANDSQWAMIYKGKLPVSVDIIKGGVNRGRLTILSDIRDLQTQLLVTVLTSFAAALLVAGFGVIGSRPLQRRIVSPLTQLTQTMQALRTSRNYSIQLADDNTPDETGILVKTFNGFMSDIRFRDRALQNLAYNDPLTGLANRVSFHRSVGEWFEENSENMSGAVVLLHVQNFRAMNDAFSHSIGDAMLMTVAASIKSHIQDNVKLARYGGDEFALLIPYANTESEIENEIRTVYAAFSKPLQIGDIELHVSLTAGAELNSNVKTADEALRHIDLALAESKALKSGRVVFFRPAMAENLQEDTALGQALRNAAKSGQFELHYQPQLDLMTDKINGFEALIRWTHPTRGPISPAVFIPLAEKNGLVSVIGEWVLNEACRQAAEWNNAGNPQRIMSINVSPAQIMAAGFVEKVRAALHDSGLPAHLLCIELTESIFIGANYAETIITLEALAKDGIKLALDDFGTGYSSLGYLAKLPFQKIKVDRSFVNKADQSQRKTAMLKYIVQMVQALGMTVVAEGAERSEEMQLLRRLNVDAVQGYFVSRPLPAEKALDCANAIDAAKQALSA